MAARALGAPTRLEALPHQEALPHPNPLPFQDAAALLVRAQAPLRVWPPPASVQVAGRLVAELRILGGLADANARGVALSSQTAYCSIAPSVASVDVRCKGAQTFAAHEASASGQGERRT